jgi:hypothetical protein
MIQDSRDVKHVMMKCPGCERPNLWVPAGFLGHMVRCKRCGFSFRATGPDRAGSGEVTSSAAANSRSAEPASTEARVAALQFAHDHAVRARVEWAAKADALREDCDVWKATAESLRAELDVALGKIERLAEIGDRNLVDELTRKLDEIREANARLRALLDLMGYPPSMPSSPEARADPALSGSPDSASSPSDRA